MRTLLIATLSLLTVNAFAIDLLAYKDGNTNTVTIADSAVESAWAATAPACLKDGSKILGVNKAFKDKKLGYRDCSNGVSATRKHKALGFSVTVLKLSELSDAKIKEVMGKVN